MTAPAQTPAPGPRSGRGISLAHKVPPPTGDYHWVYLWGLLSIPLFFYSGKGK